MADVGDWQRVAAAVRDRRASLRWTQQQAAERAGISLANWGVVEAAGRTSYRPSTLRGICIALRWSTDSIDRILRGEEPIEVPDDVPHGVSYRQVDGRVNPETVSLTERLADLAGELARRAREGRL